MVRGLFRLVIRIGRRINMRVDVDKIDPVRLYLDVNPSEYSVATTEVTKEFVELYKAYIELDEAMQNCLEKINKRCEANLKKCGPWRKESKQC